MGENSTGDESVCFSVLSEMKISHAAVFLTRISYFVSHDALIHLEVYGKSTTVFDRQLVAASLPPQAAFLLIVPSSDPFQRINFFLSYGCDGARHITKIFKNYLIR